MEEATGLVSTRVLKNPLELQSQLGKCKIFESVSLETYCGTAGDTDAQNSPSNSPASTARAKVDSRMIANYLDALGSADGNNQYTLVIRGPLNYGQNDNSLTLMLDDLEVLLTEETDPRKFSLKGIKLYDLDVKFPVTSFVNNLLMSGGVASFSMSSCNVSPAVMSGGIHISRSPTLRSVTFKGCALTDTHLGCLQASLKESVVLPNLQNLHLNGSFLQESITALLTLLEDRARELRSLSLPKRHEQFTKQHSISTTLPHLILNGKKVRHVLT